MSEAGDKEYVTLSLTIREGAIIAAALRRLRGAIIENDNSDPPFDELTSQSNDQRIKAIDAIESVLRRIEPGATRDAG